MRQTKGYQIAQTKRIEKKGDGYIVPSQTGRGKYFVDENFVCDCPDSQFHKATCKHAYATRYYLQIEQEKPNGTAKEKIPITYKQAWGAYTKAQNEEVEQFDKLLRDLVNGIQEPEQTIGRPRLSLKESLFCSIQKVYSQLSSRRAHSLFGRANKAGLLNHAPNYNAINKLLNREDITPILHELIALSSAPLKAVENDFAVDSSGFGTHNFSDYCSAKHGNTKIQNWLKAHICTGVKTNIITAVEITGEHGGDSTQFPPLLNKTYSQGFNMQEVSADKAYSSRVNLELVKSMGAMPYIPFRSNVDGKPRGSSIWRKMFLMFQLRQEEFGAHYHKRSNVEATFHMIKRKFGEKLKSKNFKAQENELLCKLVAHNIVVLIHEAREIGVKIEF